VLRDFETFNRYHPIDPVTRLCQHIAYERYNDISYGGEILRAKDMRHNYSMIDRFIEAEDDEREYRRSQYEFDDYDKDDYIDDPDPYYQEMEYWNTH
jgi:hypothetical protein